MRSFASQQTARRFVLLSSSGAKIQPIDLSLLSAPLSLLSSHFSKLFYCRLLLLFFVRKAFATTFGTLSNTSTFARGRARKTSRTISSRMAQKTPRFRTSSITSPPRFSPNPLSPLSKRCKRETHALRFLWRFLFDKLLRFLQLRLHFHHSRLHFLPCFSI